MFAIALIRNMPVLFSALGTVVHNGKSANLSCTSVVLLRHYVCYELTIKLLIEDSS